MSEPQAKAQLRQPDVFERCEAQADELALLASNILEATVHYAEARQGRMLGGMRIALAELQKYRMQLTAMLAWSERLIDGETQRHGGMQ